MCVFTLMLLMHWIRMEVVVGTAKDTAEGEFYFELIDDSKGLDEEGYLMEIKEKVTVQAEAQTAAM